MAELPLLSILDLRPGVNDTESPIALALTECVDARNVDWSAGLLGNKRNGTAAITLTASPFLTQVPTLAVSTAATDNIVNTVITFSHAGTALTARYLIVTVETRPIQTITSVTWSGQNLALQQSLDAVDGSFNVSRYVLADAGATTQNIVVTVAVATRVAIRAETWVNVSSATPPTSAIARVAATGLGTGVLMTAVATAASGTVISSAIGHKGARAYPGPGQTTLDADANGITPAAPFCQLHTARQLVATGSGGNWPVTWALSTDTDRVLVHTVMTGNTAAAGDRSIVTLLRHTPTDDVADDELWAIDNHGRVARYADGAWSAPTYVNAWVPPSDTTPDFYYINGASLHGKFFLTCRGARAGFSPTSTSFIAAVATRFYIQDRILVWDGTVLRHAGLSAPGTPTAADTAVAGAYTGTRYFRIRFTEQDSEGVTIRRSEPSAAVTFVPSGANDGAIITKEAVREFYPTGTAAATTGKADEGETHWEVEGSSDNVLFYRLATVLHTTLTYTDNATAASYSSNTLSEDVGEYVPLPSARHVVVDEDRVMIGGTKLADPVTGRLANDSRIAWTPVEADDGIMNDERFPSTTSNFVSLDGTSGGNLRGLSAADGVVLAFKHARRYRLLRTGDATQAYKPLTESTTIGAVMGGVITGLDAAGNIATYAVDPTLGLYRIGVTGDELLMDRRTRVTWQRRNKAVDPVRVLYYPDLGQVWTWAALDSATVPDRIFVFDRRRSGFTFHDGNLSAILSCALYPDSTGELRPTLGSSRLSAIQRADTGTNDDGTYYRGYVTTKPFLLGSLFSKFAVNYGVLHAVAATTAAVAVTSITRSGTTATVTTTAPHGFASNDGVIIAGATETDYNSPTGSDEYPIPVTITVTGASTFTYTVANSPTTPATGTITAKRAVTVGVRVIRDYALETLSYTAAIEARASETRVSKQMDNVSISGCFALQLEFGDPSTYTGAQLDQTWTLDGFVVKISPLEAVG